MRSCICQLKLTRITQQVRQGVLEFDITSRKEATVVKEMEVVASNKKQIVELSTDQLKDFKNHPFKVRDRYADEGFKGEHQKIWYSYTFNCTSSIK